MCKLFFFGCAAPPMEHNDISTKIVLDICPLKIVNHKNLLQPPRLKMHSSFHAFQLQACKNNLSCMTSTPHPNATLFHAGLVTRFPHVHQLQVNEFFSNLGPLQRKEILFKTINLCLFLDDMLHTLNHEKDYNVHWVIVSIALLNHKLPY